MKRQNMNQKLILKFIEDIVNSSSNKKKKIKIKITDSINTINEWDSLTTMAIAAGLNSEYGINLELSDLEKIVSVKGIINLINKKND